MNESRISAIVGGLIILVIGIMVFNYFRNINNGVTTPTSVTTENTDTSQNYVVQSGDTLWGIAQEQLGDGFRWQEIAELNNISDGSQLNTGTELILPDVETQEPELAMASAQPTVASTPEPTAMTIADEQPQTIAEPSMPVDDQVSITATSYTVVKGDNLWDIAEKAYGDGFRWKDISEANNLDNPRVIHAGNVLTLPR